jgi:phage shock protein PspC (stress-responsive transcriptional regulator)
MLPAAWGPSTSFGWRLTALRMTIFYLIIFYLIIFYLIIFYLIIFYLIIPNGSFSNQRGPVALT